MRATVIPLLRHGARVPGRDPARAVAGDIRLAQVWDEVRKRWMGQMTLVKYNRGGQPSHELTPIYEPQLVAVGGDGMTVAGFERTGTEDGRVDVAQSWWIQLGR